MRAPASCSEAKANSPNDPVVIIILFAVKKSPHRSLTMFLGKPELRIGLKRGSATRGSCRNLEGGCHEKHHAFAPVANRALAFGTFVENSGYFGWHFARHCDAF